jgi:hypothetical protein
VSFIAKENANCYALYDNTFLLFACHNNLLNQTFVRIYCNRLGQARVCNLKDFEKFLWLENFAAKMNRQGECTLRKCDKSHRFRIMHLLIFVLREIA